MDRLRPTPTILITGCLLASCITVGPDYEEPDTTEITPEEWIEPLPEGLEEGDEVDPQELAAWWVSLGDPLLTDLIERAIDENRDLGASLARMRQVRAARRIAGANYLPQVGAGAGAMRADQGFGTNTLYSGSVDASWEIDLFGGLERSVEAAEADLQSAQQNLADVLISLTSEVAFNYLEVRSIQQRLVIAARSEEIQQETLSLVESRFDAGLVTLRDVEQARANLASTRATIPSLRAGLTRARNALAVLVGQVPGSLDEELATDDPRLPDIPPSVAVGLPADAIRRRPDVRAAERRLAAETARIGVATSDLYPKLSLDGSIGVRSASASGLFSDPTGLFSVGPRLTWNVFDFGRTRARIEGQEAVAEEALALYEQTILRAVEDVQGSVVDFAEEKLRQVQLEQARTSTSESRLLAVDQYEAGLVDFIVVLDADRSLLSCRSPIRVGGPVRLRGPVWLRRPTGLRGAVRLSRSPAPASCGPSRQDYLARSTKWPSRVSTRTFSPCSM
ncbi:MAG: efflux transporter outer membrane subunit [Planctomycetota bacterium]|jgi:NodT family efflux transporter outer membrane factor (OMF) lipoprotein